MLRRCRQLYMWTIGCRQSKIGSVGNWRRNCFSCILRKRGGLNGLPLKEPELAPPAPDLAPCPILDDVPNENTTLIYLTSINCFRACVFDALRSE